MFILVLNMRYQNMNGNKIIRWLRWTREEQRGPVLIFKSHFTNNIANFCREIQRILWMYWIMKKEHIVFCFLLEIWSIFRIKRKCLYVFQEINHKIGLKSTFSRKEQCLNCNHMWIFNFISMIFYLMHNIYFCKPLIVILR